MPIAATPLIGRTRELTELAALLHDSIRLVTVTGPGGTGKTRLALQVAADVSEEYEDGTFFVPLAPLRDPELVSTAIGQAVGAKEGLAAHLRHAHEYALNPLANDEAVAFFLARASVIGQTVEPDETIATICRRLDNLPLAIELAVGRLKLLDPQALLERLDRSLPLLTGGVRDAPERHRTLAATIEWSYGLLGAEARDLLAHLSVFAGSFSIASAEHVCDADLDALQSLLELNLLKSVAGSRLLMLETIREFAHERLEETGAEQRLARRHAEHYHTLVETLRAIQTPELQSSFEHEQDNFRAALDHFIQTGPTERALEMTDSLSNYWIWGGQLDEGERWTERALAAADASPSRPRAGAISALGEFARFRGEDARAISLKEQVLEMSREIGDSTLEAATLHDLADTYAHVGNYARARELANEALEIRRRAGSPSGIAHALASLFDIELFEGHYDKARSIAEEVLEIERVHGPRSVDHSIALFALAECRRRQGEAGAIDTLHEALLIARDLKQRLYLPDMLFTAAGLLAGSDPRSAGVLVGAAEAIRRDTGFYLWDSRECERIASSIRKRLGDSRFEEASNEGADLDGDAALACAIDGLDRALAAAPGRTI